MNEYKQLQAIYEGWGGISRDSSPNDRYTATQSNHSYRGTLPFNSGGSDNLYARMALNTGVTPIEAEEETIPGDIKKSIVIDKINELLTKAVEDEMSYAVFNLGKLKEFIQSS